MKIQIRFRLITVSTRKYLKTKRQSLAAHCSGLVSIAAIPYGICGGQSGIEVGLFSEHFSFFPSDCHFIQAL
jgi:hypothetical protein